MPDSWVVDTYGALWRVPPAEPPADLNGNARNANVLTGQNLDEWDAYAKLKDGDRIGVLFRPDGELKIYKNMENVGNFKLSLDDIDIGSPIYLVCEVLGRCEAVVVNDKARCPEIPVDPATIGDDDD